MSNWLHVVTGPHHLLLNAERIREVIPCLYDAAETEGGFLLWRDRNVPVLDARRWLDLPVREAGSAAVQILCLQDTDRVVMVVCDSVLGLVRVEENAFCAIPPFGGRFTRCFDRVLPGLKGEFSLRCRHPLPENNPTRDEEASLENEGCAS